jgi:SNF family Na+-dependent transporter
MLPLGGLLTSIFAGWIMPTTAVSGELKMSGRISAALKFWLRYAVPLLLILLVLAEFLK